MSIGKQVSYLAAALADDPSLVFLRLPAGAPGAKLFAADMLNISDGPGLVFFPRGSETFSRQVAGARVLLDFMHASWHWLLLLLVPSISRTLRCVRWLHSLACPRPCCAQE